MKKYFSIDNVMKIVMVGVMILIILFSVIENNTYFEIDSYVLPIESLQHRGSIVITQEDIDYAREDMPYFYENVYTYDDLRASKLCKIDEEHWLPYYFPIYAMLCLPMKLILQLAGLDQHYAFTFTNGLMCALAFYLLYYYALKKKEKKYYYLIILMILSPIWVYLHYVGAEPVMFSALIIAMLCWREKKYRISALIISITCMMNPAIMGGGIILFLDYFTDKYFEGKKLVINKDKIIDTIKLCSCYIPSLLPFAINYYYLGVLNPTSGTGNVESILRRSLAYFFDLNFGFSSISVVLLLLFIAAFFYSILKRKKQMFMECLAVIFTVVIISFHIHINCGMINTARYVLWLYPCYAFAIFEFLSVSLEEKKKLRMSLVTLSVASVGMVFCINGKSYPYTDFNNVSKFILDRNPQFYISFCDSTFNSRTNHIDGGYDLDGYAIYCDSETNEVRKVMYCNTDENKEALDMIITPPSEETGGKRFIDLMRQESDGKIHYVNIGRNNDYQYIKGYSQLLCDWVTNFYATYGVNLTQTEAVSLTQSVIEQDETVFSEMYSLIDPNIDDSSFVHLLYAQVLGREESVGENQAWCDALLNGEDRSSVFMSFMKCSEFKSRYEIAN